MCGITGIFEYKDSHPVSEQLLKKMTDSLAHRGPDAEGIYTSGSIGLGHRRLSILDLSEQGNQPMKILDGRMVITYNGEIYNFKEIREELEKKGHNFRSNCDGEVIVHAYEEYGVNCLHMFNGMFAICLYDINKRQLFLARDRIGIKPLYYYLNDGELIFCSEIKGILQHPIKREINKSVLDKFIAIRYIPGEKTIFNNIFSFSVFFKIFINNL